MMIEVALQMKWVNWKTINGNKKHCFEKLVYNSVPSKKILEVMFFETVA